MFTEITYSKSKPEAWNNLVSHAGCALPDQPIQGPPFGPAAAADMLPTADALDANSLDANLYYGLGLGLRGFEAQLETPGVKGKTIDTLTGQFEAQQLDAQTIFGEKLTRERIDRLRQAAFHTFEPMTDSALRELSPSEQLTIEALTVVADSYRRKRVSLFPEPGTLDSDAIEKVSQGRAAARLNAINTIGGPVVIWHRAIAAKRSVEPGCPMENAREQDPTKVAARAAGLHTEEFNSSLLDKLLVPDENGNLRYDRSQQPLRPSLPPSDQMWNQILHTGREKCPAVFVGHLTLMRNILDIVWEAGMRARTS